MQMMDTDCVGKCRITVVNGVYHYDCIGVIGEEEDTNCTYYVLNKQGSSPVFLYLLCLEDSFYAASLYSVSATAIMEQYNLIQTVHLRRRP